MALASAPTYHQDSFYWHLDPGRGLNCWIPLEVVGPDNIGLAVIPGSQRGWRLTEHEPYRDDPPWGRIDAGGFRPSERLRIPLATVRAAGGV
jgi:ectoine hydroxylase-related dioxygenase (phytanoyl-CoA dioxygenase family)